MTAQLLAAALALAQVFVALAMCCALYRLLRGPRAKFLLRGEEIE